MNVLTMKSKVKPRLEKDMFVKYHLQTSSGSHGQDHRWSANLVVVCLTQAICIPNMSIVPCRNKKK